MEMDPVLIGSTDGLLKRRQSTACFRADGCFPKGKKQRNNNSSAGISFYTIVFLLAMPVSTAKLSCFLLWLFSIIFPDHKGMQQTASGVIKIILLHFLLSICKMHILFYSKQHHTFLHHLPTHPHFVQTRLTVSSSLLFCPPTVSPS